MAFQLTGRDLFRGASDNAQYNLTGQFDPELAVEEQALARKQQIADVLMRQGLQARPGATQAGRFVVPMGWAQGLAQLGEVGFGALMSQQNAEARKALAEENRRRAEAQLGTLEQEMSRTIPGTPAQPAVEGREAVIDWSGESDGTPAIAPQAAVPATPDRKVDITDAYLKATARMTHPFAIARAKEVYQTKLGQQEREDLYAEHRRQEQAKSEELRLSREAVAEEKAARVALEERQMQQRSDDIVREIAGRYKIAHEQILAQDERDQRDNTRRIEEAREKLADKKSSDEDKRRLEKYIADQTDESRKMHIASIERIAKMQVDARKEAASQVKLGPGEKLNQAGEIEFVPGSAKYSKQKNIWAADAGALQGVEGKTAATIAKIDHILSKEQAGNFNGNFGLSTLAASAYLSRGANDLRIYIDGLRSDLRSHGLDIFRKGGSIGQMTEREWPIVEQLLGNIRPSMSEDEARRVLGEIRTRLLDMRHAAKNMYERQWHDNQFYVAPETFIKGEKPVEGDVVGKTVQDGWRIEPE